MTRERLIEAAVATMPAPVHKSDVGWGELLRRSLEVSETWFPWLVLYDNGHTLGFKWADSAEMARAICVLGRPWTTESRAIQMTAILGDAVDDAVADAVAGVDWAAVEWWA